MRRRKEHVEDDQVDEQEDGDFKLRNIVAEARVAAEEEEQLAKRERKFSAGRRATSLSVPGPPATKPRPRSMIEVPRSEGQSHRRSSTDRKTSFGSMEFIPPPPLLSGASHDPKAGAQVGNCPFDVFISG